MLAELQEGKVRDGQIGPVSPVFFEAGLRLFDFVTVVSLGFVIYLIYVYDGTGTMSSRYISALLIAGVLISLMLHWFGAYNEDYLLSRRAPLKRVLGAWAVCFSLLLTIAFALKITDFYSRVWAVTWFFSTIIVFSAGRLALGVWLLNCLRSGRLAERSAILGAGREGQELLSHLLKKGDVRAQVCAFYDDRASRVPQNYKGVALSGTTQDLIKAIRRGEIDQVFVAIPWSAQERITALVQELALTPAKVLLAPESLCYAFPQRNFSHVAEIPMFKLFDRPLSGWSHLAKVLEDKFLAAMGLCLVAPVMLLIALAIKLDSPGPIFFRQARHGFNNRLFYCWKFRTMYSNQADLHCAVQTRRGDPRVTPVGRFLRKSSLDELPQLFNVLSGDMSIIGPRPHALDTKAAGRLFNDVVDTYAARHRVKPGITGWAQVNGWRGETDTEEKLRKRIEYDLYYIDNWSVWMDLKILLLTFFVVFDSKDVY
jgi:Undecaprenyl-phosphate glucose phosphotransferase